MCGITLGVVPIPAAWQAKVHLALCGRWISAPPWCIPLVKSGTSGSDRRTGSRGCLIASFIASAGSALVRENHLPPEKDTLARTGVEKEATRVPGPSVRGNLSEWMKWATSPGAFCLFWGSPWVSGGSLIASILMHLYPELALPWRSQKKQLDVHLCLSVLYLFSVTKSISPYLFLCSLWAMRQSFFLYPVTLCVYLRVCVHAIIQPILTLLPASSLPVTRHHPRCCSWSKLTKRL